MKALFKYLHENRVVDLENQLIRFTQPSVFNDPFDCTFPTSTACFEPIISEQLDTNSDIQEIISFVQRLCECAGASISKEELIQHSKNALRENPTLIETSASKINTNRDNYVMFCLTETYLNLVMWAHYANSHRGFVLEFDPTHEFFQKTPSRNVGKVEYEQRREDTVYNDGQIQGYFMKKSKDWAYENEWRIIADRNHARKIEMDSNGDYIYLFELPPSVIRTVYLGCKASDTTLEFIKNLILRQEYSHITLFKLAISNNEFALECVKFEDKYV